MAWKKNATPQSVYRRQLSVRLRELRDGVGLSLADAAAQIEINQGSLSRIESGERGTTPVLVNALLDCYGVQDPAIRDDVLDLVRADRAQSKPWWRKYSAVLSPTRYDGYLTLEANAVSLRSYEPLLLPGLLQTPAYAEAVITGMRPDLTPRQIKALVEVRLERQKERLVGECPTKLWAVVEESVLMRRIGPPEVMREQLTRLIDIEETPHITVQLLPMAIGAHPGLYGPFVLMGFSDPSADLVWLENPQNSVYLEAREDVDAYADSFDHLRARALGPPETRARIERLIKELPK
ncbi:helix-turn-helix transcriptional regulator [Streptomyces sp. NPDC088124]|uniref:helix-turn-helix domain-containing protein n=1 Tax=Streptomyces sp. NPDC088124 TaxID=3154654 RepID=UPI00343CBC03